MPYLEIAEPHRSDAITNLRFPHLLLAPTRAGPLLCGNIGEILPFDELGYGHTGETNVYSIYSGALFCWAINSFISDNISVSRDCAHIARPRRPLRLNIPYSWNSENGTTDMATWPSPTVTPVYLGTIDARRRMGRAAWYFRHLSQFGVGRP